MGSSESREEPPVHDMARLEREAAGELAMPGRPLGLFYSNPFSTFQSRNLYHLIRWWMTGDDRSDVPWDPQELDAHLPIVSPDLSRLTSPPMTGVQLMWLGHASVLVQFDGLTVLTDPVFSERCGPLGVVGHRRYRDTPCNVDDLPHIDAVVISHNHYDHLDFPSLRALNRRFGDSLRWFVPAGLEKWLRFWGCGNVTELTWWDEFYLYKNGSKFTVAAVPAQHWSWRNVVDKFRTLWCGWVVQGPTESFYFAGDTGYCYAFRQIGRRYGPFSLAAIPIGAYEPRWLMRPQHVDPEEAVYIHKDVRARRSVGIHWGTFKLSDEHYMEPKHQLARCAEAQGLGRDEFFTVCHGQVVTVGGQG